MAGMVLWPRGELSDEKAECQTCGRTPTTGTFHRAADTIFIYSCKMDPYDCYKWSYEAINGVHPYQWPNIYGFPYFFTSK